jgi:hypothetical protein
VLLAKVVTDMSLAWPVAAWISKCWRTEDSVTPPNASVVRLDTVASETALIRPRLLSRVGRPSASRLM